MNPTIEQIERIVEKKSEIREQEKIVKVIYSRKDYVTKQFKDIGYTDDDDVNEQRDLSRIELLNAYDLVLYNETRILDNKKGSLNRMIENLQR